MNLMNYKQANVTYKRWLISFIVIGTFVTAIVSIGESFLWKEALHYSSGIVLGIVFSLINIYCSYTGLQKYKELSPRSFLYLLPPIIPILVTSYFVELSFEEIATDIGKTYGFILGNLLLVMPLITGGMFALYKPVITNKG